MSHQQDENHRTRLGSFFQGLWNPEQEIVFQTEVHQTGQSPWQVRGRLDPGPV